MDNFQIETAQNVQISQNIARINDRILAFLVDLLIIIAYEVIMLFVYTSSGLSGSGLWVATLTFGLPPFLYHLLMETLNNGQSIGKAALKIRVVRLDGSPARFSNYLIRWALRIIDFSITSGACALFTFLLNDKGQRLGDIAAKTTVISERKYIGIQQTLQVDIPSNYTPLYPQVTVFSDKDIQTIKQLYQKAKHNNNYKVIDTLAHKTAGIMEITYQESSVNFISRVISDYNYYTQQ